jgi:hypothetical protein
MTLLGVSSVPASGATPRQKGDGTCLHFKVEAKSTVQRALHLSRQVFSRLIRQAREAGGLIPLVVIDFGEEGLHALSSGSEAQTWVMCQLKDLPEVVRKFSEHEEICR